jgi:hypothetical protein
MELKHLEGKQEMGRGAKRRDWSKIWVELGSGKSIHVEHVRKIPILYLDYPRLALSKNNFFFLSRSGRRLQ